MELDYFSLGCLLLLVIAGLVFYFRRNKKDKDSMERTLSVSEMEPEKHPDEEV